jgi:hypothetical protein
MTEPLFKCPLRVLLNAFLQDVIRMNADTAPVMIRTQHDGQPIDFRQFPVTAGHSVVTFKVPLTSADITAGIVFLYD